MAPVIWVVSGLAGSGKSATCRAISNLFEMPYFSADQAVENLYQDKTHNKILEKKFSNVINADGSVNRRALTEIFCTIPNAPSLLTHAVTPYVLQQYNHFLKKNAHAAEVLVEWPATVVAPPSADHTIWLHTAAPIREARLRHRNYNKLFIDTLRNTQKMHHMFGSNFIMFNGGLALEKIICAFYSIRAELYGEGADQEIVTDVI